MSFPIQLFEYEDEQTIRMIDRNGEPWFVLADVCRVLQISNPSKAASRLDDDEKTTLTSREGQAGHGAQSFNIINESGLYSLVLTSRKPEAKRFKKWITSEVLPSIRRTGQYGVSQIPAFIRRFNVNWDRVSPGHFSVINELAIRVWGRFERAGYTMPDKSPDGREIRPDVSVGKLFSSWLQEHHPELADNHSTYRHTTPEKTIDARQYPQGMWPLFMEFVDTVWIPERAENYFKGRAPAALEYLPKLISSEAAA